MVLFEPDLKRPKQDHTDSDTHRKTRAVRVLSWGVSRGQRGLESPDDRRLNFRLEFLVLGRERVVVGLKLIDLALEPSADR